MRQASAAAAAQLIHKYIGLDSALAVYLRLVNEHRACMVHVNVHVTVCFRCLLCQIYYQEVSNKND